MKERPILFSTPMVQAILRDEKCQTRRVIKPQPVMYNFGNHEALAFVRPITKRGYTAIGVERAMQSPVFINWPYGQPGDILWVRETWTTYQTVDYIRRPDGRAFSEVSDGQYAYKADDFDTIEDLRTHIRLISDCGLEEVLIDGDRWKLSIHMPRKAARLFLRVEDVRVERLQDITEEDAKAEGIEEFAKQHNLGGYWVTAFARLWDSINGKRPGCRWEDSPWVWVVTFKKLNAESKEG